MFQNTEQLRIVRLMSRFGLTETQANALATLIWGPLN